MDLHLKNHTAVIVGSASGIGLATARTFAGEGARVALWDRAETVVQVADGLANELGVRAIGLRVDVSDEEVVRSALQSTLSSLDKVDHLVHAAAIGSGKFGFPFTNLRPAATWQPE